MASPLRLSQRVRFGDYELDLTTRELSSRGERTILAPQPFQVLELLLRHPGQLVTREVLVERLWGADTFVDYEQGLKKAVNRLREALGDSAEQPRYIETLPRQGYRFIANVADDSSVLDFPSSSPEFAGPVEVTKTAQGLHRIRSSQRRGRGIMIALAGLLLGAGLAALWRWHTRTTALPKVIEIRPLTNDGLLKYSLASDQSRLFYVEREHGKSSIRQISVRGGDASTLDTPVPNPNILDYSAARSELLVASTGKQKHQELWAVGVPSGGARRVGELLVHGAAWSPDGERIAYAAEDSVFLATPEGKTISKLASLPGTPAAPRFSPGGDRIRFNFFDPEKGTLSGWEVGANGENLHRVDTGERDMDGGVWSADGRFSFSVNGLINQRLGQDIWVTPESGAGGPQRMTSGPVGYSDLVAAQDGKSLFAIGTQARMELNRFDSASRSLAPYLGGISADAITFSEDGEWAAYVSYPDLTLWRCRTDGSDRRQLTFGNEDVFLPQWSPDASQILFTSLHHRGRIFVISRDGGTPRALIPNDSHNEIDPSWSPQGDFVVFARSHLDPDLAIYKYEIESKKLSKIPGSEGRTGPRLSPDGRYVAALSRDWSVLSLYDTAQEKWTDVLRADSGGYGWAAWSGDSRFLYMRKTGYQVIRYNLETHKAEPVLDMNNFPDEAGGWVGLAPDNSILVLRDRSLHEIYRISLQIPN